MKDELRIRGGIACDKNGWFAFIEIAGQQYATKRRWLSDSGAMSHYRTKLQPLILKVKADAPKYGCTIADFGPSEEWVVK